MIFLANDIPKLKFTLAIVSFLILASSCDRSLCVSENEVFKTNDPQSQTYKTELAEVLFNAPHPDIRYWLNRYVEIEDHPYLELFVQDKTVCAKVMMRMDHRGRLEDIKRTKGESYHGA